MPSPPRRDAYELREHECVHFGHVVPLRSGIFFVLNLGPQIAQIDSGGFWKYAIPGPQIIKLKFHPKILAAELRSDTAPIRTVNNNLMA